VVASSLATGVDLLVLPIVFQFFYNRKARLFFAVLGTLVLTQVIDSFIYQVVAFPQLEEWWDQLRATYLARTGSLIWLSALTTVYLAMCPIDTTGSRRPLDIILDFFSAYSRRANCGSPYANGKGATGSSCRASVT